MSHDKRSAVELHMPNPFGNEALTAKHQRRYVRFFKDAGGPILEIGCGRGAMLKLLREAGIESYGLDASELAVKHCRERNMTAVHGDALDHIKELTASSLGGIFCAHVIEHLQPEKVAELLKECHRVIRPEGKLVLITPNAKDLRIVERFWLDTSHIRPYPQKLLTAMLEADNFRKISVMEDREPSRNLAERFIKFLVRTWFLGYMFRGDLVVVAIR